MIFKATALAGVFVLELERQADERGYFARTWDPEELRAHGLDPTIAQASVSFNHRRGTLRGLHFQAPPLEEAKLVRVTRGAVFDVVVDARSGSPTRGQHIAVTLTAEAGNQVYVPPGCAHGFQTLADATEVSYLISVRYSPEHARGFRFDDPTVGIPWPEPVTVISARDGALPPFPVE